MKILAAIVATIKSEPVIIPQGLNVGLGLAAAFGLHLTAPEIAATMTAGVFIAAAVSRQLVTPTWRLPPLPQPQPPENIP